MRSEIPKLVAAQRTDLSDWLWHFTRRDRSPLDTLLNILQTREVRGSTDRFSARPFVCFSEAPLAQLLLQSPVLEAQGYHRLSEHGVGVRKKWFYGKGGLPVIYEPDRMVSALPEDQRYRHVTLDLDRGLDYSWQREWRAACTSLVLDPKECIVVAPDIGALEGTVYEIDSDDIKEEDGWHSHLTFVQYWSFIDLSYVKEVQTIDDRAIDVFVKKELAGSEDE
jgi:hypothetical protein